MTVGEIVRRAYLCGVGDMQTFVVMLAALMLPWKQAGAAVLMYLAAGAAG